MKKAEENKMKLIKEKTLSKIAELSVNLELMCREVKGEYFKRLLHDKAIEATVKLNFSPDKTVRLFYEKMKQSTERQLIYCNCFLARYKASTLDIKEKELDKTISQKAKGILMLFKYWGSLFIKFGEDFNGELWHNELLEIISEISFNDITINTFIKEIIQLSRETLQQFDEILDEILKEG